MDATMDNQDLGMCAVSNESHAILDIQHPVWIRCRFCKAKMPTEPVDLINLTSSPSPSRPLPSHPIKREVESDHMRRDIPALYASSVGSMVRKSA